MTTYSDTQEFEGATFVRASLKCATIRFSDAELAPGKRSPKLGEGG